MITVRQAEARRNRFRRNCRCVMSEGRMRKAWRVPGTPEAGEEAMCTRLLADADNASRATMQRLIDEEA